MSNTQQSISIKDNWIFFLICPIIALLVVHIGNENDFTALLKMPSYYTDILLAFALTYATAYYIKWIFRVRFSAAQWIPLDFLKLFVFGILIPTATIILLESLYLVFLLHIPLSESSIFYLELPLILTFCAVINLIYINLLNTSQKKFLEQNLILQKEQLESITTQKESIFLVDHGATSKAITAKEVAYFIIYEKNVFLVHADGNQYLYGSTLEKIEQELDALQFIRINRKAIVNRKAILSFERLESRKLKVLLQPTPKVEVFVSKNNASKFQEWMLQKQLSA